DSRGTALSANMSETATPRKFSVEGERGSEVDERTRANPEWAGDRGGSEGNTAAVHGGLQGKDRPRGRRLEDARGHRRTAAPRRPVLVAPDDVAGGARARGTDRTDREEAGPSGTGP